MKTQDTSGAARGIDYTDPKNADAFHRAAKAFTAHVLVSKEAARRILAAEGIYTRAGKLSKNYR